MVPFSKGSYIVRAAVSSSDKADVMRLRRRFFPTDAPAGDAIDQISTQVMVQDRATDDLVACFRMLDIAQGVDLAKSYSAQFYNLKRLEAFPHPMVEIGRLCVDPAHMHLDVFHVIWGALTAYVDQMGVRMLFGCSSFQGVCPSRYVEAFALLKARYLAPSRFSPDVGSPDVYAYSGEIARPPDIATAMGQMPPLLRMYLSMGGWVSDHAVVDHDLDTLHVFTGVEVRHIPAARKRVLRAVAGVG